MIGLPGTDAIAAALDANRFHGVLPGWLPEVASEQSGRESSGRPVRPHARRTVGIRMMLPTTERLFWHCEDDSAKQESASRGRFLITEICCFLWHVVHAAAQIYPTGWSFRDPCGFGWVSRPQSIRAQLVYAARLSPRFPLGFLLTLLGARHAFLQASVRVGGVLFLVLFSHLPI